MTEGVSFNSAFGGSSGGWGGYTLRQVLPASVLTPVDGPIRITLGAGDGGLNVGAVWIGKRSGEAGFAEAPTQVFFGGNPSPSYAGGAVFESDDIDFDITGEHDIVVHLYVAWGDVRDTTTRPPGAYYRYVNYDAGTSGGEGGWSSNQAYFNNFVGRIEGVEIELPEPAPGTHRYWRMKVLGWGNNGRHCTVANEVEFLTEDEEDMTLGAPGGPIGSSQDFGGTLQGAFNRDGAATIWHDNCDGNGWIGWQFGPNPLDWPTMPMKVAWTSRSDGTYGPQDSPTDLSIEWSDDGVTWTRAWRTLGMPAFGNNTRNVVSYVDPPAQDADGHRYWRLYQEWNNANQTGIAQLELAQTPGGPNIARMVDLTANANGWYSDFYHPRRAFDGDLGNSQGEWGVNSKAGSWISVDFGAGNKYNIREIRIAPFSDNGATPRTFYWQWSDDGVSWNTDFIGIYDGTYTWGQTVAFSAPSYEAAHRYYGIAVTKSAGEKYYGGGAGTYKDLVVREIEMAATPGGPNIAVGGTPHWYRSSDSIAAAFDGNKGEPSPYNGGNTPLPAIWYDFGEGNEVVLAEVRYTRGSGYNENFRRSPAEGYFIYSDDGRSWQIADTFQDVTYVDTPGFDGQTGVISARPIGAPNAHRYWRIRGYTGNGLMRASEVEMRKSSGGFNLCAGGTPMADSAYSSAYAAAYAFNGTTGGNHWASSNWTSGNNWIGYDFGKPVEVNHIRYAPAEGQSFVMAVVESSDDALTWEAEWWITNHSWPGFVSFERPSFEDDAARYWALAGLVGNPNRDFIVGEIEMAATEGGPKHTGMTPYYFPSREAAANLIDGNVATYGYTNTNTEASYFRFDFGAGNEKVVREVRVARAAGANAMPRIVAVLRSHDGVNWQEMAREEYLWGDVWHSYLIEGDEPEPEPTLVRRRLIVVT